MKKIIITLLSLSMVMFFSGMASATDASQADDGTLSITSSGGTTCPGPSIAFTPSPSTLMDAATSATNFTIIAASSKTTGGASGNGIEYGIDSDTNVLYQKVQVADGAVSACTDEDTLPSGFIDKSGNAAPTS